jgi:glycosyltransferase involved in cell wall biosynthesis
MLEWWILERCEVSFYVESESYETAKQRGVTAVWALNSVNYAEFAEPDAAVVTEARRILIQESVDLESNLAVYAGSLTTDVHLAEVVEAVPETEGWEVVLVGEDRGLHVESLTHRVDGVFFIGAVDHDIIPGLFACAAAGIALVDAEQPLKLMEYGAASLPVLACPGKLTKRFTERQMVFVEPLPSNIANGLMQISQSPDDASARADRLRSYVEQYSWADVASKYLTTIRTQVTTR